MNKIDRIKELVKLLNKAAKAYYSEADEIMSNYEYDKLYDELVALEEETGYVQSDSPTINVGYEVLSELPKESHEKPMLSLNKTKEREELAAFLGEQNGILSWKLDGLTIVLTYVDGKLTKAVTRGNGEVGEVITGNAKVFKNIPLNIAFRGELIIRGEAVIKYSDFESINAAIENEDEKYKNPRNLCSGSVRQLNNEITAKRNVNFFAFSVVKADGVEFNDSKEEQNKWLESQGFMVVERKLVTGANVVEAVEYFADAIKDNDFPSDGLVLTFDSISYGQSLGRTAKFPRDSIAFKWADETARTHLLEVEWSASRTGLINPVAIFEPVELEGTTVSRASVHNVSIVEELMLGLGDEIEVYKANMIIPQISQNLTKSGTLVIPSECPVCNGPTKIKKQNETRSLYCTNPDCLAKQLKSFSHFVSRNAMNIDGISEATLEKFISMGFIKEYADIYHLDRYKENIVSMEGFGAKSYDNIIASVDNSRQTELPKLIFALGIANIGLANAKVICKAYNNDVDRIVMLNEEELTALEGIGDVIAESFVKYFANTKKKEQFIKLLPELNFKQEEKKEQILEGKVFVITGSVMHFANRNEIKDLIESLGGKVTGTVSANTNYLINNDVNSTSSKNKTAKKLGVEIISEEQFLSMIKGE
ncbi:MAG: NAD-dependent DNA ligase LigA [Lachnospira sp.]|nr:NAD-dependent DNA ligase LigA [Lachnospira sp.]